MKKVKQEELVLKGTISKIKFKSADNWAVFEVFTPDNDKTLNNKFKVITGKNTTCTGVLSDIIDVKTEVVCKGNWEQTKFGEQFKCSSVSPVEIKPDSEKGVLRLLTSLPGIGEIKAKKAIEEYGYKDAWEIAQTYPSVFGIYNLETALAARDKAIKLNSGADFKAISFMLSIGLTDNQIQKILNKYTPAEQALNIVKNNPYKLINDIEGFGFLTVDKIALKAGIKVNNLSRINACVMYCLTHSEKNEGNIYMHGKKIINIVLSTLTDSATKNNVNMYDMPSYDDVKKCLFQMQEDGLVIIDKEKVYSKKLLQAEKKILKKIIGE